MKTDNDIKKILQPERSVSLSSQEKSDMKNVLLSHATESLSHEVHRRSNFFLWTNWQKYAAVSFASLLLIFTGTSYASTESLPGEPLYAVKVHFVEELVGLSKFTPEQKLNYDMGLMKTRLHELKQLAQSDILLKDNDLELIHEQINDHISSALSDIEAYEKGDHEETIKKISDLNSLTQAQEKVIQSNAKFSLISKDISEARRSIDTSINSKVDNFVTQSTSEVVNEYLNHQLDDIGELIKQLTSNNSNTAQIEKLLSDAHESLIEGDMREAIISVIEAQDTIESDEYLQDGTADDDKIRGSELLDPISSTTPSNSGV